MVKPPLRTKSIGFKVSEEEYAQLETAAQASGQTLGEWCREAGCWRARTANRRRRGQTEPECKRASEARTWSRTCCSRGRSSSRSNCLGVPIRLELPAARTTAAVEESLRVTSHD